jgi:hypothetical protein
MKKRRTLVLAFGGLFVAVLAFAFLWMRTRDYHIRSWHLATRLAMGNYRSWRERIYGTALADTPQYWWGRAYRHESELLRMGYLTNCEFRLTNQMMTREFSSNFFRLIHLRVGTNDDQVWRSQALTNGMGLVPMIPTKDYAIWEQTFRECASRYASNLPATSVSARPAEGRQ